MQPRCSHRRTTVPAWSYTPGCQDMPFSHTQHLENSWLSIWSHHKIDCALVIISRLDYCNALYINIPVKLSDVLQRVINEAAQLITRASRYDHITKTLIYLHWLPIRERIKFNVLVTLKVLHNLAPTYISKFLKQHVPLAPFVLCQGVCYTKGFLLWEIDLFLVNALFLKQMFHKRWEKIMIIKTTTRTFLTFNNQSQMSPKHPRRLNLGNKSSLCEQKYHECPADWNWTIRNRIRNKIWTLP